MMNEVTILTGLLWLSGITVAIATLAVWILIVLVTARFCGLNEEKEWRDE